MIVKIARDGPVALHLHGRRRLPEESFAERIPAAFEHLLPGRGGYDVVMASPYKMHQRCASLFRRGRVVLAGDAAHVTNPTGGFGLTTGLFDAYALWPTLAAVVLEGADEALLDTWAAERRAVSSNGPTRRRAPTRTSCSTPAAATRRSWRRRCRACATWFATPTCASSG